MPSTPRASSGVRDKLFKNLTQELKDAGLVNRDGTLKTERNGNADETPMQYEGGKHMDHKGYVILPCVYATCLVCHKAEHRGTDWYFTNVAYTPLQSWGVWGHG